MPSSPRKPALTITAQLDLLAARGLLLAGADRQAMTRLLSDRGFSRLAGYWRYFETDLTTHHFALGTTVNDITDVYNYDVRLRRIVAEGLAPFEIALRSRLAYQIATIIDPYRYMEPESYIPRTVQRHGGTISLRDELIAGLHRDLGRSKDESLIRARLAGDIPPLWVAMEALSMGTVSKMYRLLADQHIRYFIARSFGYPNPAFSESVFHSMTVLRNVCAHHGRLWHRSNIQIAPRILNRLKTDADKTIYRATPWAWLITLADLTDTVAGSDTYSRKLWAHVASRPDYIDGLKYPGW